VSDETKPKRGRGRPPLGPARRFSVTLVHADAAEYDQLGGLEWLRSTLQASARWRAGTTSSDDGLALVGLAPVPLGDAKETTCKD
jgi:hypothetical protein